MKNWTISTRIVAAFAGLVALLVIVGAIGVFSLTNIEHLATDRLQNDAIPGMTSIAETSTLSLRAHIHALNASIAATDEERAKELARMAELVAEIDKAMKTYDATISAVEDRENFALLQQKRAAYARERSTYVDLLKTGRNADASHHAAGPMQIAFADYRNHATIMLHWNETTARHATSAVIQQTDSSIRLAWVVSGSGLVLTIILGWLIIRGINRTLRLVAGTLDDASSQVAAAAGEVSASSQSLAEGASEQAASLEETSSSLVELSSMTKRNADSALTAKGLSGETRHAAEIGNKDMTEMRSAMDAIKNSSNDISKIIRTIDEIAFQTNILALNAAVEAARAGEAGAGFAVVADEVRALAQRSATAAKETASKIEDSIAKSDHGAAVSTKVASSLGVIVEKARQVDELIAEIASASQEQNSGIGQINAAVSQMDKVTQGNASNAEETAAASEELSAQAKTLKETVVQLRQLVGGGQPHVAALPAARHEPVAAMNWRPQSSARTPKAPSANRAPALAAAGDFFQDT